ncbi:venom serine protease 34 [Halyomorpha halys]|uniref:venom serine protease 34 n=1 Tax=Halyomorpha halys TaxID=286706 RepID=UPI0006D525F5|nr:venom serine protease 34 [Halyomorpha halys]
MKVLVCLMVACLSWASAELSCSCGWRNRGRIVGGFETGKNEYPWMVSLSNGCGGSIITPYHVLTAAHCTHGESPSKIVVSAGRHYQYGKNQYLQNHRVARIIQHAGYDDDSDASLDDISVLVLATPIRFNQFVGPVCMPSSRYNLVGEYIKVTGWGLTKGTGSENALREVDVQVINNAVCKRSWPLLNSRLTQICAYTPKKDSCNGDSGGALVYLDPTTNRYTQVALVSYGHPECGSVAKPSVNTDVFAYLDWVKAAVAQTSPKQQICTKV